MKYPKSRDDEQIVAQDILDEYVIYDLGRQKSHALNPTAAIGAFISASCSPAEGTYACLSGGINCRIFECIGGSGTYKDWCTSLSKNVFCGNMSLSTGVR